MKADESALAFRRPKGNDRATVIDFLNESDLSPEPIWPASSQDWDALWESRVQAKKAGTEAFRTWESFALKRVLDQARQWVRSREEVSTLELAPKVMATRYDFPGEFAVEETVDALPFVVNEPAFFGEEFRYWFKKRPNNPVVLILDASLSMEGQKFFHTALALAVACLEMKEAPLGVVVFERTSRVLKKPSDPLFIEKLLHSWLELPIEGYTHLESGIEAGLELCNQMTQRVRSTAILLSDCKYTAGRDPGYLASRFQKLLVFKTGDDFSSRDLAERLAYLGHGKLIRCESHEKLPRVLNEWIREILRGRVHP